MDLDTQLQELIDDAPADGKMPRVMEKAIAPVLKLFATKLQHLEYYILQSMDRRPLLVSLAHRTQPASNKKVIYAFATLEDATSSQGNTPNPELIALPVPTSHILFQMTGISELDSTVFFDRPGDLSRGTEILREDLQAAIARQIQGLRLPKTPGRNVPPDIA